MTTVIKNASHLYQCHLQFHLVKRTSYPRRFNESKRSQKIEINQWPEGILQHNISISISMNSIHSHNIMNVGNENRQ